MKRHALWWLAVLAMLLVVKPSLGGGGHPPPPITEEELQETETVLSNPDASMEDKLKAIETIWYRPAGDEKRRNERIRILRVAAASQRHETAVRLKACVGLMRKSRRLDEPESALAERIRRLAAEVLKRRDPASVAVVADVIEKRWGFDVAHAEESRELAHAAIGHTDIQVRRAGIRALRYCGTASDARIIRRYLSNPLHDEFGAALETVGENEAIADVLRDDLLQLGRQRTLSTTVRCCAIMAIPQPYETRHLELIPAVYRKAMAEFTTASCEYRLLANVCTKAPPELAIPLLYRVTNQPAVNPWKPAGGREIAYNNMTRYYSTLTDELRAALSEGTVRNLVESGLLSDTRENKLISLHAIWVLAHEGGSWTGGIVPLLNDEDVKVRSMAVRTLGRIGPPAKDALPFLREKLKSGDRADYLHYSVRDAIQKIDRPEDTE